MEKLAETILNLNQKCIFEIHNWGSTTVMNVCNGSTHVVPWGQIDYVLPVLGVGFLGIMSVVMISLAASAIATTIDYIRYG